MPDWQTYVRERLHLQDVAPEREAAMVTELAQQLEQAARDGRPPEAEVPDWAGLARRIQTVESLQARRRWWADGRGDVAYALRGWRKFPGFVAATVLTLALGIGASTAMFSALNAVVLRRWLPSGEAHRMVYVWMPSHRIADAPLEGFGPTFGAYFLTRQNVHAFAATTLFLHGSTNVETGRATERVGMAEVRPNFFPFTGAAPLHGRTFTVADMQPGAPKVAILSSPLARAAFGGAAASLGRSLKLDGSQVRVVGVMPAAFTYPSSKEAPQSDCCFARNDIWLPLTLTAAQKASFSLVDGTGYMLARLRPGATLAQAQAQVQAVMARVNAAQPPQWAAVFGRSWYGVVQPFTEVVLGSTQRLLWLLFGAALLVLLIVCANVANLFLVRAAGRQQEWSIRAALGASRGRMFRQMLAEAALLASAGGLLGIAVAEAALRLLLHFNPGNIARLPSVTLDPTVLLFAFALTCVAVFLFALAPAWTVARRDPAGTLQASGRGTVGAPRGWRRALTVAEAALAVLLLAGAGLFLRSYANLMSAPRGFSSAPQTAALHFDSSYDQKPPKKLWAFYPHALAALRALPGVEAAALAGDAPLDQHGNIMALSIEGNSSGMQTVETQSVTPGYARAMGIAMVAGRGFRTSDLRQRRVMLVNQAFAQKYFPGHSALGQHLCTCGGHIAAGDWSTIIGVVADVRQTKLDQPPPPQIYRPLSVIYGDRATVIVRSSLPPALLSAEVRAAIRKIDPAIAVSELQSMSELVAAASAPRRFQAAVFSAFGLLALLLAAIGLYGVLAYGVRLRRGELGVRMALGADRGAIMRLVLGEGMRLALGGIAIGIAAALALTRVLASQLYGVAPRDVWNLLAVAGVLALVALGACALPAWRASRTDPLTVLHQD